MTAGYVCQIKIEAIINTRMHLIRYLTWQYFQICSCWWYKDLIFEDTKTALYLNWPAPLISPVHSAFRLKCHNKPSAITLIRTSMLSPNSGIKMSLHRSVWLCSKSARHTALCSLLALCAPVSPLILPLETEKEEGQTIPPIQPPCFSQWCWRCLRGVYVTVWNGTVNEAAVTG